VRLEDAVAAREPRAAPPRPDLSRTEPHRHLGRIDGDPSFPTKEPSMRFIPTKLHAPLDYIVGAVLIAGPWTFQYSDSGAATAISIVLGIGLIAYSLFTNYELGV